MADKRKTQGNGPDDTAAVEPVPTEDAQALADRVLAQGYIGVKVDPTPNEAYTFPGQAAGAATPETDDALAAEADAATLAEAPRQLADED